MLLILLLFFVHCSKTTNEHAKATIEDYDNAIELIQNVVKVSLKK